LTEVKLVEKQQRNYHKSRLWVIANFGLKHPFQRQKILTLKIHLKESHFVR